MKAKGFTLIELMLVVMIIAIIVGTAIPMILSLSDKPDIKIQQIVPPPNDKTFQGNY